MKQKTFVVPTVLICLMTAIAACVPNQADSGKLAVKRDGGFRQYAAGQAGSESLTDVQLKKRLIGKYQVPKEWGEQVTGVKTMLNTSEKVIALTFDACGGINGSGYDAELIHYLRQQNIPATLFINSRWIEANYWAFIALSKIPLFEIENHGTEHRPLSMNGRSAWGIKGTDNVGEIVDEVLANHRKIQKLTGREPKFFRSGTAYYDEVGVKIANELGEQIAGFRVLGDAGATYSKQQVKNALLNAAPGSIVILHMNKPKSETAEGVMLAIPELKRQGYRFVKLEDYPLK
ncbi:polysaccharide deacetylase family protein [Ferviditalea candida]|uniref:Polysaccharide deacetylase family protein n=1 Tax=Ferviditalea candida TaxID=3108399 RepID=A0ABU5ZH35_9BACL|nr:polysaccharide deacetylase family protein [Paenibacillaceae bacterium T2]